MALEIRNLTPDDYEQASYMESRAFYNTPSPERVEQMRKFFPPQWTLAGFIDGQIVADVRMIPFVRMMSGAEMPFAAIGPVASLAAYRRQGYTGQVLTASIEQMKDRGQVLAGLFTPHDALYRRYGWERAEGKIQYSFPPREVRLRKLPEGGHTVPGDAEDWQRLERVYSEQMAGRNGPYKRAPVWWSEVVTHDNDDLKRKERDVVIWVDEQGADRGYLVYQDRPNGVREGGWEKREVWVRDFIALDADAYLGLWAHLLTHDLADKVVIETRVDDPFRDLTYEPQWIQARQVEGPMIRVTDVESAFNQRPYTGERPASFTMRVEDQTAPWNQGTWRIEAADGVTHAERTDAGPDIELSVNYVAPLFTGYTTPEIAARTGMITVRRLEALAEVTRALAVTDIPYSQDFY